MSFWCSINQDNLMVKNFFLIPLAIPLVWGVYELRRAVNQFLLFQDKVDQFLSLSYKHGKSLDSVNKKVENVFNGYLIEYPFLKKIELTIDKINRIVNLPPDLSPDSPPDLPPDSPPDSPINSEE